MTFRTRLTVASALVVTGAIIAAMLLTYLVLRSTLYDRVDSQLRAQVPFMREVDRRTGRVPEPPQGPRGSAQSFVQVLDADGKITDSQFATGVGPMGAGPRGNGPGGSGPGGERFAQQPRFPQAEATDDDDVPLEVTAATRQVLNGDTRIALDDQQIDGQHLRVMNIARRDGGVVQIARSLDDIDAPLNRVRNLLIGVAAFSVLLAIALGAMVTQVASTPVRRLQRAVRDVTERHDLSVRISETSGDEIGRLAQDFNTMLDELSEARDAQQRLVEDASHELRTPLTSITTNLEVLALQGDLSDKQRQIVTDVNEQVSDLSELAANLVELAHGNRPAIAPVEVELVDLVAESVARAERAAGGRVQFDQDASPCSVIADRERLQAAVDNMLSNAVKWSPENGRVKVVVHDGEVSVLDEGPGVPDDDKPFIFDRFYRSVVARGKPGAGLGLAIARSVADECGGTMTIEDGPNGTGALFRLRLPAA